MAARARLCRSARHRGPDFLRPVLFFGDPSGAERAAGTALGRRAVAFAHSLPERFERRPRGGAAPFLRPVSSAGKTSGRARAGIRPRARREPRIAAGRIPPRETRFRHCVLPHHSAHPRHLSPDPAIRRRHAQEHADRIARRAALRTQESGRYAARSPGTHDRLFPSGQRRRNPMKLSSKTFCAALALALVAACADPLVKDTRALLNEGRTEEALAAFEKATRQDPQNHVYRSEYFRVRAFAVAQWLVQADSLRAASQFEGAEELYRRVLKYDAANERATQGLAQVDLDRRHRALVAEADKLVKVEKYRDARELLGTVLAENPAQRDARQLQRQIEEKTTKPAVALLQLRSSVTKPISLELKDVPLRTGFDVSARAAGLNFLSARALPPAQTTPKYLPSRT